MSEYDCSSFAELEFYDDDDFGGDGEGDAVSDLEREGQKRERESGREREREQVRKRERDIKSSYRTRSPPSPSPSTTLLPILFLSRPSFKQRSLYSLARERDRERESLFSILLSNCRLLHLRKIEGWRKDTGFPDALVLQVMLLRIVEKAFL